MKLLSLNMDVQLPVSPQRLEILGKLVNEKRPNFIALQSVTTDTLKKISSQPWAALYKTASIPTTFERRKKPTCAVLSRYPSKETKMFEYRSPESPHQLVYAYYGLLDKQKQSHVVTVASTQLLGGPSEEDSLTREKHLNQAMYTLREEEDCLLVGDFGIHEDVDGSQQIFAGWKDAWLCVTGGSTGPEEGITHLNSKSRSDRVFFKSRRYQPSSVEVVMSNPVPELGGVCLSSHFGLLATFTEVDPILPYVSVEDIPCVFSRPLQPQ